MKLKPAAMPAAELLAALVGISSVSHEPNRPVIDFVRGRLEPLGWTTIFFPYRDPAGVEKCNALLLSTPPADPDLTRSPHAVELAILSHTDTVPYAPAWPEGGRLETDGARLVGRGACDVKGFLAAAVCALESLGDPRRHRPLALVLTADEEIGCVGAKRLVESGVLRARLAVVGEPTSLRPVRAGKGYGLAEVSVRGREAHSAFPAAGASAIFAAARLLASVEKIAARLERDDRAAGAGAAFEPPFTTLNVGTIQGGTAKNIVPGECRFLVEWRPVPGAAPRRAFHWLEAACARLVRQHAGLRAEARLLRLDPGFETAADSAWVRRWESWTGASAGTVSFGTEAPHAARFGAETVVLGPGDMHDAHRPGEFVLRRDLERCTATLHAAALAICGG